MLSKDPKFTGWENLGTFTFTPDDTDRVIGGFTLSEGDEYLWVRIRSLSQPDPWPWSYGILGWKSSEGYELGSIKAYSKTESEVFRLGNGLSPMVRSGVITFEPRGFNLAWIRKGNPWTLVFSAQSGSVGSGAPPLFGTRSTLGVLGNADGAGIPYTISDGTAKLNLS